MGKIKIVEIVLNAISSLVSVAKGVIKFIGYVYKLMKRKPGDSFA
jgi:hypothetical protein